jgi:signal transduction histidine kinase
MRRRLALLVSVTMALTLFAFMVPLAILIRIIVADQAIAEATDDVRSLSTLVAADPSPSAVRLAISLRLAGRPVTVFLPGQRPIGAPAGRTAAVRLAERGQSFTAAEPAGREILVAVEGLPDNRTAVVRTFLSNADLTRGVAGSWLILAALGLILLGIGVIVANLLVGTVTRPISELARVSHLLAAGGLEARADPAGPPEVRELAQGLNHLAGRIRELIWQERESVADLSHRLRTPLTGLRLELEAMADAADPDGRLGFQVQALESAVTSLIEDARTRGSGEPGNCDAAAVARQRMAFWSVLAHDQGRDMLAEIPEGQVYVGVAVPELTACLDALLGNVFAHTPQGTSLAVRLRSRADGGARLSVQDSGPGFAHADLVHRGASGGGSTGLGLDIARQTAQASNGSLTIAPGPGGHVIVELGPPASAGLPLAGLGPGADLAGPAAR